MSKVNRSSKTARTTSTKRKAAVKTLMSADVNILAAEMRPLAMWRTAASAVADMKFDADDVKGLMSNKAQKQISKVAYDVAHKVGTAQDAEIVLNVLKLAIGSTPLLPEETRLVTVKLIDDVIEKFFTAYGDAMMITGIAVGQRMAEGAR